MQQVIQRPGITFAVDEVAPAKSLLAECRIHEAVKSLVGEIESCCDYHGTVVSGISYQPLLAAVYLAFSSHRPLVLTPDVVWLTIAQGVAHHMAIHGERLRSRFVSHESRLLLTCQVQGWVKGSPENLWPEAFATWAGMIREHVGPRMHDALVCDFSTTGPLERTVSQVVMMDVFERYFEYELRCVCGIPRVTLEGTPEDWQRLADKAAALKVFDMDWWLPSLLPICKQFVRASRGDVVLSHWQGICKLRDAYGGNIINGWIARLFPYLKGANGSFTRRNPIFATGEGFSTTSAPTGLSHVPFKWSNAETGDTRFMEAIAGLVGVTQDPESLELRPKVGWAVRVGKTMDRLLSRLTEEHTTFPGLRREGRLDLPPDLADFYLRSDGAEMFGQGSAVAFRFVPLDRVGELAAAESRARRSTTSHSKEGLAWSRFTQLPDGSWLAINVNASWYLDSLSMSASLGARAAELRSRFAPICHVTGNTADHPSNNPVIALSFTELLERLLDSGGTPYWLEAGFACYGNAEQFTHPPD